MIYLLDTSKKHFALAAHELKVKEKCIGQLLTPRSGYPNRGGIFAIDNSAYARFRPTSFFSRLNKELPNIDRCKFVSVPDVVGSARRTLELFNYFKKQLKPWPLALVCQDGQGELPIPWNHISAVFIGGTTDFKLSQEAIAIIKTAQAMGKWVHVGRVNTPSRVLWCEQLKVDSIDGTGISRYSHMRERIAKERNSKLRSITDILKDKT